MPKQIGDHAIPNPAAASATGMTEVQRQEALLKTGALQRAIFNSANFSCIATDAKGVIQIFNVGAERMFGYTAAEVMNKMTPADMSDPQELIARAKSLSVELETPITAGFEALVFKASRGIEDIYELTKIRKDGSRIPAVVSVTALRDAQDAIIGYLLIGTDNTARMQIEEERRQLVEELQVSEERFALAARGANDGIWDWDLMTDKMMLSPRWKSMLGYDEDELTDSISTWLALLHPDDKGPVWESMSRYLAGDTDSFEGESRLRHKDGRYVPVLTRGFALRRESDGAARRFVGTNTDLTELRTVEASLRLAITELQRSNQDLEQFAYVASHDLQEPLRMVASFTQLLAHRYADELDQDAQDFIGYAVDGATRMQQLIQDLLAYSRVTTRGAPSAPVDVRGALDEALMNLESAIAESGAVVTADDLPAALGDRTQVVQVLQNLIGNGIKFRRPEVSPHVHLSARPDSGNDSLWLFQVADNGIGIDPKYADRVFVIFQRLQSRQEYPGTGIGLALCKRIVERHGGTIWLQPDLADGTTVNFTLPKAESGSSEEGDTDGRSD